MGIGGSHSNSSPLLPLPSHLPTSHRRKIGMEFGMEIGAPPAYLYGLHSTDIFAPTSTAPRHPAQFSTSFADNFYVPSEEAAELEWLSNFVEDSFSAAVPYPAASVPQIVADPVQSSSPRNVGAERSGVRRCCAHCASERTPQWRTGPLGPKTLCNACGVRYKSGRLVPEYRPASSPTFVLTQHSNSHRKVMELRRQKEVHHQPQSDESFVYHDRLITLS